MTPRECAEGAIAQLFDVARNGSTDAARIASSQALIAFAALGLNQKELEQLADSVVARLTADGKEARK